MRKNQFRVSRALYIKDQTLNFGPLVLLSNPGTKVLNYLENTKNKTL